MEITYLPQVDEREALMFIDLHELLDDEGTFVIPADDAEEIACVILNTIEEGERN